MALELDIHTKESVEVRVHKLATGVCNARAKMVRVQLELNLEITELQLKAQPSTPSEVREQRTTVVTSVIAVVNSAVAEFMQRFEQSFEVLTTLQ